ncbi:hypothetical protein [Gordoniibacillus kamchatkensis]|nr:hypothetical protein [Paenibacillus sp. VKM B-2647]
MANDLERAERVPYCRPGLEDLGEAVRRKTGGANVLLLKARVFDHLREQ